MVKSIENEGLVACVPFTGSSLFRFQDPTYPTCVLRQNQYPESLSGTKKATTSPGAKKGDLFLADVNTKLINKNITTDVKVDTNSKLFTTITIDEPAHGMKTIFSFVVPDQRSGKVELPYLQEYAGISSSIGLTASPMVNFSGVAGKDTVALGTDVSFDTATGNFTKYNAALSFSTSDLIASLILPGEKAQAILEDLVFPFSEALRSSSKSSKTTSLLEELAVIVCVCGNEPEETEICMQITWQLMHPKLGPNVVDTKPSPRIIAAV